MNDYELCKACEYVNDCRKVTKLCVDCVYFTSCNIKGTFGRCKLKGYNLQCFDDIDQILKEEYENGNN